MTRSAPVILKEQADNEQRPLVSLITPSLNSKPYLRAAIESVLAQDYPNIEYLIMDGGSDDGSVELLERYGSRVKWISERDNGQANAIARGIGLTTGPIVGWLNADDVLKPGAVSTIVEGFRRWPDAALVYGDADFIDQLGRVIGECPVVERFDRKRLLLYGDYIVQPAAFFARAVYEAVGGLDETLNWAMDWDLWLRLAANHDFAYVRQPIASYRWLGSNKTAVGGLDRLHEVEMVARRHGAHGLPVYFRLEKARLHGEWASRHLRAWQPARALVDCGAMAASILASWRTVLSLADPHVWRNYGMAQRLYRSVKTNTENG